MHCEYTGDDDDDDDDDETYIVVVALAVTHVIFVLGR